MSPVVPDLNFNLSNDDWKTIVQYFDKNPIPSAVKESNAQPLGLFIEEQLSDIFEQSAHQNPAVNKYRSHKKWDLEMKIVVCEKAREAVRLWHGQSIVVSEIWKARHDAVESAWNYQRSLVEHVLESDQCNAAMDEESKLAIGALENDQSQAVDAVQKSLHEALTFLKASSQAVEVLRRPTSKTTAAFEKVRDETLDDVEKARDGVFEAVRKSDAVIFFHTVWIPLDELALDALAVREARDDDACCAKALKIEDGTSADFQKLHDQVGATLRKTHNKAAAIFQKFYDETTANLQKARCEGVPSKNISEFITPFQKVCDEAITAQKAHCSALEAFKKFQDETASTFNKYVDLSIILQKAINEARVSSLKSANEANTDATLKKLPRNEVFAAELAQDELFTALGKDDRALAALLKAQDEALATIENLQDQVKALASLTEVIPK